MDNALIKNLRKREFGQSLYVVVHGGNARLRTYTKTYCVAIRILAALGCSDLH